ncbi:MAG: hypothetical protein NC209_00960 [Alistipes sp.]|nr:hypothetical protein [Alistipes senegalensis]MCM1249703.1 hypothetical protein [Alistipes sp.]
MKRAAMKTAAIAAAAALLTACRMDHRSVAADVDPEAWSEAAELLLHNDDTLSRCNLSLFLRYDPHFREDTLTFRIEVRTPDSLSHTETFLFCAPHRRLPPAIHGEATLPYRRRAVLARSGGYRFLIAPVRPIAGVEAVGLYVETE